MLPSSRLQDAHGFSEDPRPDCHASLVRKATETT